MLAVPAGEGGMRKEIHLTGRRLARRASPVTTRVSHALRRTIRWGVVPAASLREVSACSVSSRYINSLRLCTRLGQTGPERIVVRDITQSIWVPALTAACLAACAGTVAQGRGAKLSGDGPQAGSQAQVERAQVAQPPLASEEASQASTASAPPAAAAEPSQAPGPTAEQVDQPPPSAAGLPTTATWTW